MVKSLRLTSANQGAGNTPGGDAAVGVSILREDPDEALRVADLGLDDGVMSIVERDAAARSVSEGDGSINGLFDRQMNVGNTRSDGVTSLELQGEARSSREGASGDERQEPPRHCEIRGPS